MRRSYLPTRSLGVLKSKIFGWSFVDYSQLYMPTSSGRNQHCSYRARATVVRQSLNYAVLFIYHYQIARSLWVMHDLENDAGTYLKIMEKWIRSTFCVLSVLYNTK